MVFDNLAFLPSLAFFWIWFVFFLKKCLATLSRVRSSRLAAVLYENGLLFYCVYSLLPDDRPERKRKGSSKNWNAMWKTYY